MELEQWSPAVIRKAEMFIEEGNLQRDANHPEVWWVTPSEGGKPYRVQTDGQHWIACSCPNGQRQNGLSPHCWHTAAVLMQYLPDKGRFHNWTTAPDPEKPVDIRCTCWSPEGGHDPDCAVWTAIT